MKESAMYDEKRFTPTPRDVAPSARRADANGLDPHRMDHGTPRPATPSQPTPSQPTRSTLTARQRREESRLTFADTIIVQRPVAPRAITAKGTPPVPVPEPAPEPSHGSPIVAWFLIAFAVFAATVLAMAGCGALSLMFGGTE
jgi:hypothetical protein